MTDSAGEPTAYQRGQMQGQTDQTLINFAEHFKQINGSQEKTANALIQLVADLSAIRMALQQLKDEFKAATETVRVTAEALEKAVRQQRDTDEQKRVTADRRWTPVQRAVAVLTVLLVAAGVIAAFLALT